MTPEERFERHERWLEEHDRMMAEHGRNRAEHDRRRPTPTPGMERFDARLETLLESHARTDVRLNRAIRLGVREAGAERAKAANWLRR
jgi:hypothetical protein